MNATKFAYKVGEIVYSKYNERIIIDDNFSIDKLYNIIDNDPDYKAFRVYDGDKLIYTTENALREVTFFNGIEYETVIGILIPLGDKQRFVLKQFLTNYEIDLYESDITRINKSIVLNIPILQLDEKVLGRDYNALTGKFKFKSKKTWYIFQDKFTTKKSALEHLINQRKKISNILNKLKELAHA